MFNNVLKTCQDVLKVSSQNYFWKLTLQTITNIASDLSWPAVEFAEANKSESFDANLPPFNWIHDQLVVIDNIANALRLPDFEDDQNAQVPFSHISIVIFLTH